ncbi:MAG: MobF family relaxase [Gemmataceae bacterium]
MLRMTQQTAAAAAKKYFARSDYLGQELVGDWGGKAADALGLSGRVNKRAFDALCDNVNPATGGRLTPRTKDGRTVGYDFTFDGPKSVSVLYALTQDPEILAAFRASARETMAEIETDVRVRVRARGQNAEADTGALAWAEFVHFTARPVDGVPDPQLHAHCFAFNATVDGAGRWRAAQFREVMRDMPYHQAAFHARLADRLAGLGYGIARTADGWQVAGLDDPALLAKFSRRTSQIEEEADRLGVTDPGRKAALGATTREGKAAHLARDELRAEWEARLTPAERARLAAVHARAEVGLVPAVTPAAAVDHAVRHCFERSSVVPVRTLAAEALKFGVGSVSVDAVARELAARPLLRGDRDGRVLATTPDVLAEEGRMIAFARTGRGRCRTLGDPDRPPSRGWLSAAQRTAVARVLGSRDRVVLVRGAAGTGKTTMLQEAVEGMEAAGRRVVVLAPSAKASREVLRGEGFAAADTVARFLVDERMRERVRPGDVVLVDEAGLVGTPTMAKLFTAAEQLDARVVLVGDQRQHGSVERGAALRLLEERAGIKPAELAEVRRQSGAYKRAVELLSGGKPAAGLAALDALGWVKEVPDAERYKLLATDYQAATGGPATCLVVSPTHREAARVTAEIRSARASAGQLTGERLLPVWVPAHRTEAERADAASYRPGEMLQFHRNAAGFSRGARLVVADPAAVPTAAAARFQVYRPAELAVAAGDRLRVTANGKTRDGRHRLENGSLLTVAGFTAGGDLVDHRGWVIGRDFGHLSHGYCVTSHASQGASVDRVLVAESAASFAAASREQFYVSVSRGKRAATVYTDDIRELARAVGRSDPRLGAIELVAGRPGMAARARAHLERVRRHATEQVRRLAARGQGYDRQRQGMTYE